MKHQYSTVPVAKGDEIELEIIDLAFGGDGVGKYNDFTIFVPMGLPGDKLIAVITEVKKHYAFAFIKKVIKDSPYYTLPVCPDFKECGGCQWLNMRYPKQVEYKVHFLEHELTKAGVMDHLRIKKAIEYDTPLFYRDRAQYKVDIVNGNIKMGFYKAKSHEVINIKKCYIVNEKINEIAEVLRVLLNKEKREITIYDEKRHRGYLRHIGIRVNKKGESLVTFVIAKDIVKDSIKRIAYELKNIVDDIKGIVVNINKGKGNRVFGDREKIVWGEEYIYEEVRGIQFELGSDTFFQVNSVKLEEMLKFVDKHLHRNSRVLDLYGGVGALTLPFHKKLKEVMVVEINFRSIEIFDTIVRDNEIDNATIVSGDAEKEASKIIAETHPDTIILDPPRKGVHRNVLQSIMDNKIKDVIYISCNPITFARDIDILKEVYKIEEVVPVDLFPHTFHVETMSALKLKS